MQEGLEERKAEKVDMEAVSYTHLIQALSFIKRAFSSAGSEHLPYKQRVGGSNPSTPTTMATYSIRMNNEEVFKGNGIGEFRVNIAEIVETGITDARILSDNTCLLYTSRCV